MKPTLWTGFLLALALALPLRAAAWDNAPLKVNGGVKVYLKVQVGNAALPLAPWYLYFPAEARHQPIGPSMPYPNWQPPPAAGAFAYPPPAQRPLPAPTPDAPPTGFQRTSYRTTAAPQQQVPAYWYGQ